MVNHLIGDDKKSSRLNPWLFMIANHVWGSAYYHGVMRAFTDQRHNDQHRLNPFDQQILQYDPQEFSEVLFKKIEERYTHLIDIYENYLNASMRANDEDEIVVHTEATTKVLDYGLKYPMTSEKAAVIFVPSLINKSYIFDIPHKNNILSYFAQNGLRPYVVSWGDLNTDTMDMGLEDYVETRLVPIIQFLSALNQNQPLYVVSYCMGGLLTLGSYSKIKNLVGGLLMLAVPWDFSDQNKKNLYAHLLGSIESYLNTYGYVPGEFLKTMFSFVNPVVVLRKFQKLARLPLHKRKEFIDLEDWVNDSVDLPRKVAIQCFKHWFIQNELSTKGTLDTFKVGRDVINKPSFIVIPSNDRIVDEHSALGLSQKFSNPTVLKPQLGHVGVITASKAKSMVWEPMLQWIHNQSQ